jgi:hypothetical protein
MSMTDDERAHYNRLKIETVAAFKLRVEYINIMDQLHTLLMEAHECGYGSDDWRSRVAKVLE